MANIMLTAEEQHMFEGQPKGFPFGDFDLEDVMLPEDDDMGIPSDTDDDGQEDDVQAESGFGNVLGASVLVHAPWHLPPLHAQTQSSRRKGAATARSACRCRSV